MNPLDLKLYNLFTPYDYDTDGWVEAPQLHDVFRVAEERGWLVEIKWGLITVTFKNRTYTSSKFEASIPLLS